MIFITDMPTAVNQQQMQNQLNPQRQSVHKRIGTKVILPFQQNNVAQNSVITGYKIVRVRAKDGSVLIKKVLYLYIIFYSSVYFY